ncbi:hypothetical protein E2C01_004286 [Portunus trituberculatus]|uniref:Uncharacterized protein n=1 Tax=Portunus trituberculatus TaxID=210409 RepID=A0A5B7CSM4_PORTR|nr:hypothetical protein [Portunus trituberculatus]
MSVASSGREIPTFVELDKFPAKPELLQCMSEKEYRILRGFGNSSAPIAMKYLTEELHQREESLHSGMEGLHQVVEGLHQVVEGLHQVVEGLHQVVEGLHQVVVELHQEEVAVSSPNSCGNLTV